jgi:hypothetical protein
MSSTVAKQCCPDGLFLHIPKIPILMHIMRPWDVKFWDVSRPFGIFLWQYWYIFPRFGLLYQEKSGNPVPKPTLRTLMCGWLTLPNLL